MRSRYLVILVISLAVTGGCITEFIPDTDESTNILVVEGIITDQHRTNKIRISRSLPLGKFVSPKPVKGCLVNIIDENGVSHRLREYPTGTYSTDSTIFRGRVGGKYTLRIVTGNLTYVSSEMEMLPVPPIDSLYYIKDVLVASDVFGKSEEGCSIFLNTFDPEKRCLFYRWDYTETWEFRLPYAVPNNRCWITEPCNRIHIRNTSIYGQAKVTNYPLLSITNATDRLKEKYSIIVYQYSLNADEYNYWEKLKNVSDNVGGLYDVTPMAISSNIRSQNNPDEIVLGYFSVSAVAQKRIFIKERFEGMPYLYNNCAADTIFGGSNVPIPGLNAWVWVIEDQSSNILSPFRVITYARDCADCTTRGSAVMPSFWED